MPRSSAGKIQKKLILLDHGCPSLSPWDADKAVEAQITCNNLKTIKQLLECQYRLYRLWLASQVAIRVPIDPLTAIPFANFQILRSLAVFMKEDVPAELVPVVQLLKLKGCCSLYKPPDNPEDVVSKTFPDISAERRQELVSDIRSHPGRYDPVVPSEDFDIFLQGVPESVLDAHSSTCFRGPIAYSSKRKMLRFSKKHALPSPGSNLYVDRLIQPSKYNDPNFQYSLSIPHKVPLG